MEDQARLRHPRHPLLQMPLLATSTPAPPTPVEALGGLTADADFHADFSGENGRQAQVAAMRKKTELTKTAHGPPIEAPTVVMPEQIARRPR